MKLLWEDMQDLRLAAIARITCWCLFSPPGWDGQITTEPTFNTGSLAALSDTSLQGFAFCPQCLSNSVRLYPAGEGIQMPASVLTATILTMKTGPYVFPTPAHSSQLLAVWFFITSPFASCCSAHSNGSEYFTCASPNISFLRCLLT